MYVAFGFKENYPVALLIAIEGIHKGEIFELNRGETTVGRSDDMMVRLKNDETVSRNVHCLILYDENNMCFAKPGQARGMTYIDKKLLLEKTELNDREIIILGKSKLMLIMICNDKFLWIEEK